MATEADREEPIDPDVDVHVAEQRGELVRTHGAVLLVIALGGGLGALARHAVRVRPSELFEGFFVARLTKG